MPSPAMTLSIIAAAFLTWPTSPVHGSSECIFATLPSILNFDQCIGTSLELCNATTEELVQAVGKVVECVAVELVTISPLSALSALIDIVLIVVGAVGSILGELTNVLDPLCALVDVPGCTTLLTGGDTCKQPIQVSLPSSLNIGQCLTDTLLECQEGELATDKVLINIVQALACLLSTLMESDPEMVMSSMGCTVIYILEAAASVNIMTKLTLGSVVAAVQVVVQCG